MNENALQESSLPSLFQTIHLSHHSVQITWLDWKQLPKPLQQSSQLDSGF